MSGALYGLLVGVDKYLPPAPTLDGCVNDIRCIESFLTTRCEGGSLVPHLKSLINEQATRQAIIDGFLNHLALAGPEDVAVFYYSGHGSQEPTPPEWWDREPDHLNETLVCYDSRVPGNFDLADKELQALIAHVARKNPHILVVLDCCHSGSGTREVSSDTVGGKTRHAPARGFPRKIESFLTIPGDTQSVGRHILLAACREDEEAKETGADGQARGVFSWVLTQTLQKSGGKFTYRDLFQRVNAMVQSRFARQSPLIEATEPQELDRPFLGGAIEPHPPYYFVSFQKGAGWLVDGGAVHGFPAATDNETVVLNLYPTTASSAELLTPAHSIGSARVIEVMAATSKVAINLNNGMPDESQSYHAIVAALPVPRLGVRITGDAQAAEYLRQEIATHGPNGTESQIVVERPDDAVLQVTASAERYRILRVSEVRPLAVDVDGATPEAARTAVNRLEHIAKWLRILELKNPATRLPAGCVSLDLFRVRQSGEEHLVDPIADPQALRFCYETVDGKSVSGKFKIRITNRSSQKLYCMLFDLPETFGVDSELLDGNGQWLEPNGEVWARTPKKKTLVISAIVPQLYFDRGITELKDTLKVIASTEKCDATVFDQDDLDVNIKRGDMEHPYAAPNTLQRLMGRVKNRKVGDEEDSEPDAVADWTTTELTVRIIRPLAYLTVPTEGESVELSPGVFLKAPSQFSAVARLSRDVTVSRSADEQSALHPPVPFWLLDDPNVVSAFEFSASRGGEPGLSVLELDHVEAADTLRVTPDSPLILGVERPLPPGESVLPYSYDGEFYMPLGFAQPVGDLTEIRLVRLPPPLATGKDLKGSIRIYFKKVTSKVVGTTYEYPILAVVRSEGGVVAYHKDIQTVRSAVGGAQRILVYIHGIIGDTIAMTKSAFPDDTSAKLPFAHPSEKYDLILAFDYENLNTPIKQTARDLKTRLAEAGLAEGHQKYVHLVAHSMGGLVSRWFVEQLGGNEIVNRLTMLGTPNAGSPWPAVENLISTLIGMGLNGLAIVPWPPTVLGSLMGTMSRVAAKAVSQKEKIQVALDDMNFDSPFLKELAESKDPHIPYSIIAGNTSLTADGCADRRGRLRRLLDRLAPNRLVTEFVFGEPNDLAVSVKAIEQLPVPRTPIPDVVVVACDHLSYFSTTAVLGELVKGD